MLLCLSVKWESKAAFLSISLDPNSIHLLLATTQYCLLSTPRTCSKSLLYNFYDRFWKKQYLLLERLMVCYSTSRYSKLCWEQASWTQWLAPGVLVLRGAVALCLYSVNRYWCLVCATSCSRCWALVIKTALFTVICWGNFSYGLHRSSCVSSREFYASPKQPIGLNLKDIMNLNDDTLFPFCFGRLEGSRLNFMACC